jgi:hypothetical protein
MIEEIKPTVFRFRVTHLCSTPTDEHPNGCHPGNSCGPGSILVLLFRFGFPTSFLCLSSRGILSGSDPCRLCSIPRMLFGLCLPSSLLSIIRSRLLGGNPRSLGFIQSLLLRFCLPSSLPGLLGAAFSLAVRSTSACSAAARSAS